jgi:hypothetical protein
MREQIETLMKQAGTDTSGKWMGIEHAEKFAELIICKCAQIGELKEQGYEQYDPSVSVGWYMKQYFGVKE